MDFRAFEQVVIVVDVVGVGDISEVLHSFL
jgi:hypothetical protein